jgi:hypothetical protein
LDALNIEGREVTGNAVIIECILVETHLLEVGVKNVNPAATEVGGKKEMLPSISARIAPFVNGPVVWARHLGMVDFDNRSGCLNPRIPTLDGCHLR